jgi:hypothetical protein
MVSSTDSQPTILYNNITLTVMAISTLRTPLYYTEFILHIIYTYTIIYEFGSGAQTLDPRHWHINTSNNLSK